ncbi:MAG: hypothetical protein ACRC3H_02625 [Lachnospiraceae bacterium]
MITLHIDSYCHNCLEFEAEVNKTEYFAEFKSYLYETNITCAHAGRCRKIKEYLGEVVRDEQEGNERVPTHETRS